MAQGRSEPRISVNKLGEYLVATPVRRRRIVVDQKRPRDFVVARYREAYEAIVAFIEGGGTEDEIIERAIDGLMEKTITSEFQEQDRDLSIEALGAFLDMADSMSLEGITFRRGEPDPPRLLIAGVSVSVRPDVVLAARKSTGEPTAGLLKLYLAKSVPLTDEAGSYIGAALQRYAMEQLASAGAVDYRLCQTFDVFARKVHTAPRYYSKRRNDIEAACQEIARAWSSL